MGIFTGRLLAADIDDTIRPYGAAAVPADNLAAIRYFMEEGGLFTIATGRDPFSYLSIASQFPSNTAAILSNGAVLFDPDTGEDIYESFLPFDCRRDFHELLEKYPAVGMEIVRGTDIRVCGKTALCAAHLANMGAPLMEADMDRVMFPWTKVVIIADEELHDENLLAAEICSWLTETFPGKYDAVRAGAIVDITKAGSNKGTGVSMLARFSGIEPENVICIGDSYNDIPMLEMAGKAFAPENAVQAVKDVPGVRVVGRCDHCIADVIDILKGEAG